MLSSFHLRKSGCQYSPFIFRHSLLDLLPEASRSFSSALKSGSFPMKCLNLTFPRPKESLSSTKLSSNLFVVFFWTFVNDCFKSPILIFFLSWRYQNINIVSIWPIFPFLLYFSAIQPWGSASFLLSCLSSMTPIIFLSLNVIYCKNLKWFFLFF